MSGSGIIRVIRVHSWLKKPCAENRMAEIVSPASDPRSLRRHYPHQVQGVVQLDLSAIAAPPHYEEKDKGRSKK
jgi:hypothetical protein